MVKRYSTLPFTSLQILKILLIIAFNLLISSYCILIQNPTRGYEISIYSSTPLTFWLFQIIAISIGICILLYYAFIKNDNYFWLFSFLLLLMCNFSITALHSLKGYYLYNPVDSAAHVGIIKDMIFEGHIGLSNYNPLAHVLVAQLAQVGGLSVISIVGYIPSFYTVLNVLFIYLLAKTVLTTKGQVILASAMAGIVMFYGSIHASFYPQAMGMFFYPLFFYLYFKSQDSSIQFRLLFLIFIVCYPFIHFIPSVSLIPFLIIAEIITAYYNKKINKNNRMEIVSIKPVFILIIISFIWFSYFVFFGQGIIRLVSWLQGELIYVPQGIQTENLFQYLGLHDALEILFRAYLDNMIYVILSLLGVIFILFNIYINPKMKYLVVLSSLFLVAAPLHIALMLVVAQASLGRFLNLNLMMWATPVLAAYALFSIVKRKNALNLIIVCSFLLLICTTSIVGIYQSPYLLSSNLQVTQESMQGNEWFFKNKNENLSFAAMGSTKAIYGVLSGMNSSDRTDIRTSFYQMVYNRNRVLPPHFNYPSNKRYGQNFEENTYLIMDQNFKSILKHPLLSKKTTTAEPVFWKDFNENDIITFNQDESVSKTYSNGGFDVFYVIAVNRYF